MKFSSILLTVVLALNSVQSKAIVNFNTNLEKQKNTIDCNEQNINYFDMDNIDIKFNNESNAVDILKREQIKKCIVNSLNNNKNFDFKFNTFEADDSSVVYFTDKQIIIINSDGKSEVIDYTEDSNGKIILSGGNEKNTKISFSKNELKLNHKNYELSNNKLVIDGKIYTVTQEDRNRCFIEDTEQSKIIFIYDHKNWGVKTPVETAFIRGSFTSWKDKSEFSMTYSKNLNLHYVDVDVDNIKYSIGNSGHPEYKFYVNNEYKGTENAKFVPEGYIFHTSDNNLIVIFSNEDINEVITESNVAGTVKHLSDFDLTTREGKEEISNFRLVPGTKKLFRSFHPYYSTGGRNVNFDTEKTRLALVQELAAAEGIKSDINLTDDYSKYEGNEMQWYDGTKSKVTIPKYYQDIMKSDSVCHVQSASGVVPSYDYVYNKPTDPLFNEWVQIIVDFIISDAHEAPFQIHCAIGTDRTGVFSALLGALCGASWDEVSEDYQKTNRMCIREYRSKALLAQSFQRILNVKDITQVDNLQEALWNHFTTTTLNGEPVLTKEKLEALNNKLN